MLLLKTSTAPALEEEHLFSIFSSLSNVFSEGDIGDEMFFIALAVNREEYIYI